jgi:hypothetical protein
MNSGTYLYHKYPFPFRIAVIVMGFYAGGNYHEYSGDQFISKDALNICRDLIFSHKTPEGHNCKSCAKTCRNLTCYDYCCDYEPMLGMGIRFIL